MLTSIKSLSVLKITEYRYMKNYVFFAGAANLLMFIVFLSFLHGTNESQYWNPITNYRSQCFQVSSTYTLLFKTWQPEPASYEFPIWKMQIFPNHFPFCRCWKRSSLLHKLQMSSHLLEQYCRQFKLSIDHLTYRTCL